MVLKNDPLVTQVNFDDANLSYITTDGMLATLSESIDSDGTRIWVVRQRGTADRLEINAQKNEIRLNGNPLAVEILQTEKKANTTEQKGNGVLGKTEWFVMGTGTQYHVQLEKTVRTATVALLHTVMFAVMGPIGTGLGIAQAIISVAISYNSNSTALFVKRQIYRDYHYLQYKYEDNYYFDSNYTQWAYYNETIVTSAN